MRAMLTCTVDGSLTSHHHRLSCKPSITKKVDIAIDNHEITRDIHVRNIEKTAMSPIDDRFKCYTMVRKSDSVDGIEVE